MASELEALVSHLYIVGGRAVSASPPGALAASAPKRAPRIRQEETLFILIVPAGTFKGTADLYHSLAESASELYFQTTGSMTNGLREMLLHLNQKVKKQRNSSGQPFEISVICAVMRDQEIYLARSGPLIAFFYDGSRLATFPSDRSAANLALFPPLGENETPRIELNRYELSLNSILVLADQGLPEASDDRLKTVLAGDINEVLDPLRLLIEAPLAHLSVIQFVTEDTPTPPAPDLRATLPQKVSELPAPAAPIPAPAAPRPPQPPQPPFLRRIAAGIGHGLAGIAGGISGLGERIFPPEPEEGGRSIPWLSNLVVLLGMLIPLVIVVVVVSLALSQTGSTEFEICRLEVFERRDAAAQLRQSAIDTQDQAKAVEARTQWVLVQEEALACEQFKPGDEEMRTIAGQAQNVLDNFDRITRREITAMRQFEPNADLRGPVSGNWIQLYTLDRNNDVVYEDVLSEDGRSLVQVSEQPTIFEGQSIGSEIVRELVDIAWMERNAFLTGQNNVPIVLDETGLLVAYSSTMEQYYVHRLILPVSGWTPAAMTTWRLNLYVLDVATSQIWRYVPNRGIYSDHPEEYFSGQERPDLRNAVDFGIDEDGSLYILFADGVTRKYRGGQEVPFNYFNLPEDALANASSLFVDNNPQTRGLVITDPVAGTVYTMSLGGTVYDGFRPLNTNALEAFKGASGALVNGDRNVIYVLAGNFMYRFELILIGSG